MDQMGNRVGHKPRRAARSAPLVASELLLLAWHCFVRCLPKIGDSVQTSDATTDASNVQADVISPQMSMSFHLFVAPSILVCSPWKDVVPGHTSFLAYQLRVLSLVLSMCPMRCTSTKSFVMSNSVKYVDSTLSHYCALLFPMNCVAWNRVVCCSVRFHSTALVSSAVSLFFVIDVSPVLATSPHSHVNKTNMRPRCMEAKWRFGICNLNLHSTNIFQS